MMPWFSIHHGEESDRISIFNEIAAYSSPAEQLLKQLPGVRRAMVLINSPGGSSTDALLLHDAFSRIKVTTTITGHAASAAVIIAQAGRSRRIYENGTIMVHAPVNFVSGNAPILRRHADALEKINDRCAAILMERTGQPAKVVAEWLSGKKDYWFTAREALRAGLVDKIIPPPISEFPANDAQLTQAAADGPTEQEAMALEMIMALGPLRVRDRARFGANLAAWFTNEVRTA